MCSYLRFGRLIAFVRNSWVGNIELHIPSGFSVTVPRTRGALERQIDSRTLQSWRLLEQALADCKNYSASLGHPSDLAIELLPPVFPGAALRLEVRSNRRFQYYFIYAQPGGGGIYGRRKIVISKTDRYAFHYLLIADPIPQGVKIADHLLKRAVDFYKKICVTRIELVASLDRGGALWPKFGFIPKTPSDWQNCKNPILKNRGDQNSAVQEK